MHRDDSRWIVSCRNLIKTAPIHLNAHSMTQSGLSWQWPFWVTMIFSGVCLLLFYFFVPETYAPVLLQWKAKALRKADPVGNKDVYAEHERGDWSVKGVTRRTFSRSVEMVLKEKILVFVTIYLSFVYGIMYSREFPPTLSTLGLTESCSIVFEALPIVFSTKRNFSAGQLGLIYIGMFRDSGGWSDLTPF